ncbi:hypothetical protein WOLCODRAFT_161059 [Wolfiporia cocos MD-104 SS10]|uniref:Uncharacterized protein n=1 Tax=Wolfiporia cocos (strain MD-104) TaxID=742152 RepID=A0A2H3J854_WOLCO|nr:hypothetical protein WOLCODRAFT_161059 [Wolfiporia cocos MD-104 SS10]
MADRSRRRKPKPEETCLSIKQDGSRCLQPPTDGPRCSMHQKQYRTMYKRYKEAADIVDEMEKVELPPVPEIEQYADLRLAKEKATWLRQYIEAIRVEKSGREVHSKRFFMKIDNGHKMRIKLLERKMVKALDVMDVLQERVFDLQFRQDPAYAWIKRFQKDSPDIAPKAKDDHFQFSDILKRSSHATESAVVVEADESEDDDPIEFLMRAQKREYLKEYHFIRQSSEDFMDSLSDQDRSDPDYVRKCNIRRDMVLQYTRRVILYDPVLMLKAEGKVSWNDLFLDPDFTVEDFIRLEAGWEKGLQIGLLWWKDSALDAISMWPKVGQKNTSANVGSLKDRVKLVGGWVFNVRHTRAMTNEAWWHLLDALRPPPNIENRFMNLFNNFDELQTFMSYAAFGLVPSPSFCRESDTAAFRGHLSMCGVVLGDVVTSMAYFGPVPATKPASRPGLIQWAEAQSRSYVFGAVRDGDDPFARAFLTQLRMRPEKFLVFTHSDMDPGEQLEQFGGYADETFYTMRARNFEAPPAPFENRPRGRGEWTVARWCRDVLFGTDRQMLPDMPVPGIKGYLTELKTERNGGWLFWLKKDRFPVKYFVIFSVEPGDNSFELVRDIAWAALQAARYAPRREPYSTGAYVKAADVLKRKRFEELFGWLPASVAVIRYKSVREEMPNENLRRTFPIERLRRFFS